MMQPASASWPRSFMHVLEWLLVVGLFVWGMLSWPLPLMGPDNSYVPGDLIGTRSNIHKLEQFEQFRRGRVGSYWDAPVMYPLYGATLHSDPMIGSGMIHSIFRWAGYERETSYQLWLLAMFSLNYWITVLALWSWLRKPWIAGCGAFLFAFGIMGAACVGDATLQPRFMMPVAIILLLRWLNVGTVRSLILAVVAVAIQVYFSLSLGIVLVIGMACIMIGYLIVHRPHLHKIQSASGEQLIALGPSAAILIVLALPLILGYRHLPENTADMLAYPSDRTARIDHLFTAHPSALSWQDLAPRKDDGHFETPGRTFFTGILPWLALLLVPLIMLRRKSALDGHRRMSVLAIGVLLLLTLFLIHPLVQQLLHRLTIPWPNTPAPFAMLILCCIMLLVAQVADVLSSRPLITMMTAASLVVLLLIDNNVDHLRIDRFDKHLVKRRVAEVLRHLQLQDDGTHEALAYGRILPSQPKEPWRSNAQQINVDAMLAAQELGRPIANGNSRNYTDRYSIFLDHLDPPSLQNYCGLTGCEIGSIQWADNVSLPIDLVQRTCLLAYNHRYVSADHARGNALFASATVPQEWEAFALVHLKNGKAALLAHNDRWIWSDTLQNSMAKAEVPEVGDLTLFSIEKDQSRIAFKTSAGRYLSVRDDGSLVAGAAGADSTCWFLLAPLPHGYR